MEPEPDRETVPVYSYAKLFDVVMDYYPVLASESLVARFVKRGEITSSFAIGVDQINLYDCETPALLALLRRLSECMDVCVELDTYSAAAYVGGVRDSAAAAGSANFVPSFAPFNRHVRRDIATFAADEIALEDLEPLRYFVIIFETRGLEIFRRALRAALCCLDETATTPQEFRFVMPGLPGRSSCSISHHPCFAEDLLHDDVVLVQSSVLCVDETSFYEDSRSIQFNSKAAALQAFRLWRQAYCPCSFLPLEGVGSYLEIGCYDKEICGARDRYWQAKIDLQRAEHDERVHSKSRALRLCERSHEAARNAQYWQAQAQQCGISSMFHAQALHFAMQAERESERLGGYAARIPEPRDLAPLRLAVDETRGAGEAALEAWLNMAAQQEVVDSRNNPAALAEAEADVLAFANVLERMPEPIGLCFKDISGESGGVFHQYLCELLKNEPVSITKLVSVDPETDDDGLYPDDEMRVNEVVCLIPTRDMTWNGVAPFLHGIKVAENREGTAKRTHTTSAAKDLSQLLLDSRLLRTKGNLVSSFMAGAIVSFLPRTGN
jgi:hypothetical protein